MLDLINDILNLAKIGAGMLDVTLEPVLIDMICQASLQMIKQAAHQKNLAVTARTDPAVVQISADARRLKQILINLLANAVKFTPVGGAVGLEVVGDLTEHVVRFTIWDTGIGIADEQLPLLFQPFVQLDSRLARQYEGTGLGLALVARMAELHGGSVAVTSVVGVGSRFTVTLPWNISTVKPDPIMPIRHRRVNNPSAFQPVLIIEDSKTIVEQLTRYLNELGVAHIVQADGHDACAQVIAIAPELIILDILLPDKTGWDVLIELKADSRTQAIPVVIASVVDDRQRAMTLGAAGYLAKPFTRAALQSVLETLHVSVHQALGQHAVGQITARVPTGIQPVLLIAEDNEATIMLLSDYLSMHGYRIIVARNGIEAIARVHETHPAIVLMDIQMPGMDGLEAIQHIRAEYNQPDMPIIALTALAMPGDRERCLAAGATDYLTKPVSLRGLAELIDTHLQHQGSSQRNNS
ncbi:MAG: response regulator [Roseiflexaceae bacterium]|nr:response regulator [Roseiflexaceae bacterium]